MKKYLSWMMAICLIFALTGCGNGENPTSGTDAGGNPISSVTNANGGQSGSKPNQSSASNTHPNTSSSSGSSSSDAQSNTSTTNTSSQQGGINRPFINATEDYVLVTAYDSHRGENYYKFVDRKVLIRFINSRGTDGYFDYFDLMYNVGYTIPFDFEHAEPFDRNNLANVTWNHPDQGMGAFLINSYGEFVIGEGRPISFIVESDEDYLALYHLSDDLSSGSQWYQGVLYDKYGNELARYPKMGIARYEGGRFITTNGEFDAKTLDPIDILVADPIEAPDADYFSWSDNLGNGYYAVADLSDLSEDKRSYVLGSPLGFKKALWYQGMRETPYSEFIIRQVKPYGNHIFYFSGDNGNFITNVMTGEKYNQFTLGNKTEDWDYVLYPGLLVGWSAQEMVLMTDVDITTSSWVYRSNGVLTYNKLLMDKTIRVTTPQVILDDPAVMEDINLGLSRIMHQKFNEYDVDQDVVLGEMTMYGFPSRYKNVLTVLERADGSSYAYPDPLHLVYYFNFDLDSGDAIHFVDWFDEPELAKESIMEFVNEYFMDAHPNKFGNVTDFDGTYLYDDWNEMIEPTMGENAGFTIHFNRLTMGIEGLGTFDVPVPVQVFSNYIKPEYLDFFFE